MEHVMHIELDSEDMDIVVDILNGKMIKHLTNQSIYKDHFGVNIGRMELLTFLKKYLNNIPQNALRKFYKELNYRITYIGTKLEKSNRKYEMILKSKKLRDLRELFSNVELNEHELKAIPLFLKVKKIEYNNNIAFMIENEIYIRNRINKEISLLNTESNYVFEEVFDRELEEEFNNACKKVGLNDEYYEIENNKSLQTEIDSNDIEIGNYKELSQEDFYEIIKSLENHSSKIKEKFKKLLLEFEEYGPHAEDKLYELWMKWTDDEVTVIDRVLKKSMYDEVINRNDIYELEEMSENIMHRHLLSRIVLHLIYRRISSQFIEDIFK